MLLNFIFSVFLSSFIFWIFKVNKTSYILGYSMLVFVLSFIYFLHIGFEFITVTFMIIYIIWTILIFLFLLFDINNENIKPNKFFYCSSSIIGNGVVNWLWSNFTVESLVFVRFFELHYISLTLLVGLILLYVSLVCNIDYFSRYDLTFKKDLQYFGLGFMIKELFVFISIFTALILIFFYCLNLCFYYEINLENLRRSISFSNIYENLVFFDAQSYFSKLQPISICLYKPGAASKATKKYKKKNFSTINTDHLDLRNEAIDIILYYVYEDNLKNVDMQQLCSDFNKLYPFISEKWMLLFEIQENKGDLKKVQVQLGALIFCAWNMVELRDKLIYKDLESVKLISYELDEKFKLVSSKWLPVLKYLLVFVIKLELDSVQQGLNARSSASDFQVVAFDVINNGPAYKKFKLSTEDELLLSKYSSLKDLETLETKENILKDLVKLHIISTEVDFYLYHRIKDEALSASDFRTAMSAMNSILLIGNIIVNKKFLQELAPEFLFIFSLSGITCKLLKSKLNFIEETNLLRIVYIKD